MGAAWREVKDGPQFDAVLEMVRGIRALGMEACCTLGMLTGEQAVRLKEAGLSAYNHNLDTSREYYDAIITPGLMTIAWKRLDAFAKLASPSVAEELLGWANRSRIDANC
jgi:hypothetical protein